MAIDYSQLPSPCFILDEARLRKNLELIHKVQQEAEVRIILALKGYALWRSFPLVRQYLSGATASSLHEALLCVEEFGSKAHTYAPAYLPDEFEQIIDLSSHITFNSIEQFKRFYPQVQASGKKVSCGIRVNPEYSDVETDLYNPAAPGSRLGMTVEQFEEGLPEGVEGLHFHTLCESDSYSLERVLQALEKRFAPFLRKVKWLNMGGGHLMTREGYDVPHLISLLRDFQGRYPNLQLILEPGGAIAWQTGELKATVLDIVESRGIKTAILDTSFTAHMPDTLEMPYRPKILGATDPVEGKPSYRLGGLTCLAGDFLTEYSFDKELQVGDDLILLDMMHYTMVKTTLFNGVGHPAIAIWREDDSLEIVRKFQYLDFKNRLS
jgi:carboxynorspermidine decarboxylase